MLLKSIDHITINVRDLKKSLGFYKNIFELEELNQVDMGDHVITYMQLPGSSRLEFIEYCTSSRLVGCSKTDKGIFRHVAFTVDNLEDIKARCENFGVKISLSPIYVDKLGCKVLLIEDPNGIEIELVEKVRDR